VFVLVLTTIPLLKGSASPFDPGTQEISAAPLKV
jgi:hypothetical protein